MPFRRTRSIRLVAKSSMQMVSIHEQELCQSMAVRHVSQTLPRCGACYSKVAQLKILLRGSCLSREKTRLRLRLWSVFTWYLRCLSLHLNFPKCESSVMCSVLTEEYYLNWFPDCSV